MFERAARLKLRFATTRGSLSIEELWDMPLSSKNSFNLDCLAISLYKKIKENPGSFVKSMSEVDPIDALKFNLIKHIIEVKLHEAEMAKKSLDRKAKRQQILGLIQDKENDELRGKSKDELLKELDSL